MQWKLQGGVIFVLENYQIVVFFKKKFWGAFWRFLAWKGALPDSELLETLLAIWQMDIVLKGQIVTGLRARISAALNTADRGLLLTTRVCGNNLDYPSHSRSSSMSL